jgi:hypothetical protein
VRLPGRLKIKQTPKPLSKFKLNMCQIRNVIWEIYVVNILDEKCGEAEFVTNDSIK